MNAPTRCALVAALLSLTTASAFGQALAVKAGTDGAGVELEYGFGSVFGARLQVNGGTFSHHLTKTSVYYDGHLRFRNAMALADWHPGGGSWRVSAGLVYNDNKVDLNALPTGGTFTINGNTYPAASVGSYKGTLSFDKVAPYLGSAGLLGIMHDDGWEVIGFTLPK